MEEDFRYDDENDGCVIMFLEIERITRYIVFKAGLHGNRWIRGVMVSALDFYPGDRGSIDSPSGRKCL